MAFRRTLSGWEVGAEYGIGGIGDTGTFLWVNNVANANTGCYYGRCLTVATPGVNGFFVLLQSALTPPVTPGEILSARARCFLNIQSNVDVAGATILRLGETGVFGSDAVIRLSPSRTWQLFNSATGGATAFSSTALPLNTWHQADLSFSILRGAGSFTLNQSATIAGETLSLGPDVTGIFAVAFNVFEMGFNNGNNNPAPPQTGEIWYDDAVLLIETTPDVSPALPTTTKIRIAIPTGQGSLAAWVGSFTDLQEVPYTGDTDGQTSAVAGAGTTFLHHTAVELGIASVTAVRTYAYVERVPGGGSTEDILMGGVAFPVVVTGPGVASGNAVPNATEFVTLTPAQWNAFEYGMQNTTGVSLGLYDIHAEVLYDPTIIEGFNGCGLAPDVCDGERGAPRTDGLPYTAPSVAVCGGGSGARGTARIGV